MDRESVSKRAPKIGVKYCGNCNPRISGRALMNQLAEILPKAVWLPADSPEKEILLVICGCTVDCATRPEWLGQTVVVAGETLDKQVCEKEQLAEAICQRLELVWVNLEKGELSGGGSVMNEEEGIS